MSADDDGNSRVEIDAARVPDVEPAPPEPEVESTIQPEPLADAEAMISVAVAEPPSDAFDTNADAKAPESRSASPVIDHSIEKIVEPSPISTVDLPLPPLNFTDSPRKLVRKGSSMPSRAPLASRLADGSKPEAGTPKSISTKPRKSLTSKGKQDISPLPALPALSEEEQKQIRVKSRWSRAFFYAKAAIRFNQAAFRSRVASKWIGNAYRPDGKMLRAATLIVSAEINAEQELMSPSSNSNSTAELKYLALQQKRRLERQKVKFNNDAPVLSRSDSVSSVSSHFSDDRSVDENAPSPPRGPATPTAADRTPAALSLDDTADLIAPQHSPSHIVIAKRPATNRKPIKFRQVGLSFKQDSNSREEIGLLHSAAQAAGHQISHTTAPHQSETPGTLDVVLGSDSAGVMHRAGHTPRSDHNLYDMRQRLVSLYQQQRQQQQQQQQQQTPTQPAQASRVPDTDAKQSLPKLALPPLPVSLNLTLSASEPEGPVSTLNNRRRMSRLFPPMKIKSNSITAPISQQINQTAATATNNLADYTPALQGDKVKGMLLSAEKQKQLQPELQSLDDLDMQIASSIALRHKMKYNALVVDEIKRWWYTCRRIGVDQLIYISHVDFFNLLCLLYSSLVRELDIKEIGFWASKDSSAELESKPGLSWSSFHHFMYEIVDNWTESFSAFEYAAFLRKLYADVTVVDRRFYEQQTPSTHTVAASINYRRFLRLDEHFERKRKEKREERKNRHEMVQAALQAGHFASHEEFEHDAIDREVEEAAADKAYIAEVAAQTNRFTSGLIAAAQCAHARVKYQQALRLFHVLRILSALSVGLSVAKRVHDREPKLQDFLPGRFASATDFFSRHSLQVLEDLNTDSVSRLAALQPGKRSNVQSFRSLSISQKPAEQSEQPESTAIPTVSSLKRLTTIAEVVDMKQHASDEESEDEEARDEEHDSEQECSDEQSTEEYAEDGNLQPQQYPDFREGSDAEEDAEPDDGVTSHIPNFKMSGFNNIQMQRQPSSAQAMTKHRTSSSHTLLRGTTMIRRQRSTENQDLGRGQIVNDEMRTGDPWEDMVFNYCEPEDYLNPYKHLMPPTAATKSLFRTRPAGFAWISLICTLKPINFPPYVSKASLLQFDEQGALVADSLATYIKPIDDADEDMYLIDASAVASAHAQKVHEEFPVSRSATMDGSGGAMLVAAQLRMQERFARSELEKWPGVLVVSQLTDTTLLRLGSFARLLLAMLPPVEAGDALGIHVQSEQACAAVIVRALNTMVDAAHQQLSEIATEAASTALRMCNLEDDAATRRRAQEQAVGSAVAVASSALFPPLSKRLIDALLPRVHKMQSKCWLQPFDKNWQYIPDGWRNFVMGYRKAEWEKQKAIDDIEKERLAHEAEARRRAEQAAADLVAEMEALKREQEERLAEERRTLELETAQALALATALQEAQTEAETQQRLEELNALSAKLSATHSKLTRARSNRPVLTPSSLMFGQSEDEGKDKQFFGNEKIGDGVAQLKRAQKSFKELKMALNAPNSTWIRTPLNMQNRVNQYLAPLLKAKDGAEQEALHLALTAHERSPEEIAAANSLSMLKRLRSMVSNQSMGNNSNASSSASLNNQNSPMSGPVAAPEEEPEEQNQTRLSVVVSAISGPSTLYASHPLFAEKNKKQRRGSHVEMLSKLKATDGLGDFHLLEVDEHQQEQKSKYRTLRQEQLDVETLKTLQQRDAQVHAAEKHKVEFHTDDAVPENPFRRVWSGSINSLLASANPAPPPPVDLQLTGTSATRVVPPTQAIVSKSRRTQSSSTSSPVSQPESPSRAVLVTVAEEEEEPHQESGNLQASMEIATLAPEAPDNAQPASNSPSSGPIVSDIETVAALLSSYFHKASSPEPTAAELKSGSPVEPAPKPTPRAAQGELGITGSRLITPARPSIVADKSKPVNYRLPSPAPPTTMQLSALSPRVMRATPAARTVRAPLYRPRSHVSTVAHVPQTEPIKAEVESRPVSVHSHVDDVDDIDQHSDTGSIHNDADKPMSFFVDALEQATTPANELDDEHVERVAVAVTDDISESIAEPAPGQSSEIVVAAAEVAVQPETEEVVLDSAPAASHDEIDPQQDQPATNSLVDSFEDVYVSESPVESSDHAEAGVQFESRSPSADDEALQIQLESTPPPATPVTPSLPSTQIYQQHAVTPRAVSHARFSSRISSHLDDYELFDDRDGSPVPHDRPRTSHSAFDDRMAAIEAFEQQQHRLSSARLSSRPVPKGSLNMSNSMLSGSAAASASNADLTHNDISARAESKQSIMSKASPRVNLRRHRQQIVSSPPTVDAKPAVVTLSSTLLPVDRSIHTPRMSPPRSRRHVEPAPTPEALAPAPSPIDATMNHAAYYNQFDSSEPKLNPLYHYEPLQPHQFNRPAPASPAQTSASPRVRRGHVPTPKGFFHNAGKLRTMVPASPAPLTSAADDMKLSATSKVLNSTRQTARVNASSVLRHAATQALTDAVHFDA